MHLAASPRLHPAAATAPRAAPPSAARDAAAPAPRPAPRAGGAAGLARAPAPGTPRDSCRPARATARRATPGGGVLDAPTLTPGVSSRPASKPRRPRPYRVLLHNDDVNRREYVVRVLIKVVDGMCVEDAYQCMEEAHTNGVGVVACVDQPTAELYCERLRGSGLIASVEPAGGGGGGDEGGAQ